MNDIISLLFHFALFFEEGKGTIKFNINNIPVKNILIF